MSHPAVSIVTPVHNAAATLPETIASIRAQIFEDWELWLVDDGSEDGSDRVIANAVVGDPRISAISLPRQSGAAVARNAAIAAARGRFIAFLDADDLWDADKLSVQVPLLEDGAGLVFSAFRRIDAEGRLLGIVPAPARLNYSQALFGNRIGCLTAVYDTAVYGKVTMPLIERRQDYALWLKLLRQGGEAHGMERCLATYRVRPGSLSANKIRAARATWRVFRDCEKLGLFRSLWYFSYYAAHAMRQRASGAISKRMPEH